VLILFDHDTHFSRHQPYSTAKIVAQNALRVQINAELLQLFHIIQLRQQIKSLSCHARMAGAGRRSQGRIYKRRARANVRSSRLTSVRLPGIHNSDISVMKYNRLTERLDFIFRADFINAFSSPRFFSGSVTDVNNGNFGRVSGASDQSNLPRFVQFSLKLQV
jgi:hypothetical protein